MNIPRSAKSPLYGNYDYSTIFNTSGTVGGLALLGTAEHTIDVVSEKQFIINQDEKFQASSPSLPLCVPKIGMYRIYCCVPPTRGSEEIRQC